MCGQLMKCYNSLIVKEKVNIGTFSCASAILHSMELERETRIYTAHLDEWRQSHLGEFVLIKDEEVVDFFPSLNDAFSCGTNRFGLDEFFIKQITPLDMVNISLFGRSLQAL
jgi:hypothetical protein